MHLNKLIVVVSFLFLLSCNNNIVQKKQASGKNLDTLLENYWQERMQLFPIEATGYGDNRYNDKMTITISEQFRDSLGKFYAKYLSEINEIDSTKLNKNDLISYRLFKYEMNARDRKSVV